MDSFNILIWVTLGLIIIALVFHFYYRNEKRELRTFSDLESFAKENNSTISSFDRWDKTLIGIDNRETNNLFFIRTIGDKEFREVIKLSELRNCQFIKTERVVQYNKEKVHVIDKIELVFSFGDTHKPNRILEFYNADYDSLTLSGELQLAQKWSGIVNSILNTNQQWENEVKVQAPHPLNKPEGHAHVTASQRKVKHTIHETHAI